MEKFTKLAAIAAPIMRQNIDTDMVIRVERLRDLPPEKLGPYAFESWRYKPDGSEAPEFVLNRPPYRDAKVILAADNFGCGSSREAAVWSLFAFGIRCVIAPSFGPIFYNNCFQNGLLPVALPLEVIEELVAEVEASQGTGKVSIDLEACTVTSPSGKVTSFKIDPLRREALLSGQDQIEQTRGREKEIAAFEQGDRQRFPWLYQSA
ncbi:MAG TPA: 3-isopropylmalate dehydratase small subunit [Reyranella sp.]|nr:3-isopropylmalate dehydratase small subunit [Reyranella sp.]